MEATQLLASTADVVKLEILPASQSGLSVRPQDTGTFLGDTKTCQDLWELYSKKKKNRGIEGLN